MFFYKNHTFWNGFQDIHCIMTPEGTKPDATHQNPWSIRFQCYPDILSKRFYTKTIPSGMNSKIFIMLGRPKGPNQMLRIRILDRYVFSVIPTSYLKRFSTKTIPCGMNFKMLIVLGRPKGPNQTLRIRILDRYVFSVIPTSRQQRFLQKPYLLE